MVVIDDGLTGRDLTRFGSTSREKEELRCGLHKAGADGISQL